MSSKRTFASDDLKSGGDHLACREVRAVRNSSRRRTIYVAGPGTRHVGTNVVRPREYILLVGRLYDPLNRISSRQGMTPSRRPSSLSTGTTGGRVCQPLDRHGHDVCQLGSIYCARVSVCSEMLKEKYFAMLARRPLCPHGAGTSSQADLTAAPRCKRSNTNRLNRHCLVCEAQAC